jgi:hypothetical protein
MKLSSLLTLIVLTLLTCLIQVSPAFPQQETKPQEEGNTAQYLPNTTITKPLVQGEILSQPQEETTKEKTQQANDISWRKEDVWPPVWSNWALVLVALGAAYIGLRTLSAIKRQAEIATEGVEVNRIAAEAAKQSADVADKSLRVVERAWLAVVFDQPFQPQARPVTPIYFTVKNIGNTVALLKLKKINAKRWEFSFIPERQLEPKPMSTLPTIAVIFPGDKLMLDGLVDIPFTQTDIDTAITAPLLFDVYGYVAYDDVFGIRHMTRFCQVFNPQENDGKGGFDFPREAQPSYNNAD